MPNASEPTATAATPEVDASKAKFIVIFLALGGLSFAVLQSLVAPALITIGRDLKASEANVSWILTAYLLSASVMTPILGRLGDMLGKRRVLIAVLSVLFLGTLIAAIAPNLTVLIIARVLQGAAGAVMPLSIAIVRDEIPHEKVAVTIGLLSAIFGVGAGVGIVAAGPIVQHLSWHALFWIPLFLIAVALIGAIFGIPESPVRKPGQLDIPGATILSISLVSLLLSVSKGQAWGWTSGKTLGLLTFGVLTLALFIFVEFKVKEPLIDLKLMKFRGVWTANLVGLAFGFAMFGTFILIPTLLQLPQSTGYGFGMSVSTAGLYLLPTVMAMVVFGPLAGALVQRIGPKVPLVIGGLTLILAFVVASQAHAKTSQIIASGIFTGAGIGFAFAAMSIAIIESVPALQSGEAISVNTIARTIGSSIGTAVIASLITSHSTPQGMPTNAAFTIGFRVCAAVAILAFLAALAGPSRKRRRQEAVAHGVTDLLE